MTFHRHSIVVLVLAVAACLSANASSARTTNNHPHQPHDGLATTRTSSERQQQEPRIDDDVSSFGMLFQSTKVTKNGDTNHDHDAVHKTLVERNNDEEIVDVKTRTLQKPRPQPQGPPTKKESIIAKRKKTRKIRIMIAVIISSMAFMLPLYYLVRVILRLSRNDFDDDDDNVMMYDQNELVSLRQEQHEREIEEAREQQLQFQRSVGGPRSERGRISPGRGGRGRGGGRDRMPPGRGRGRGPPPGRGRGRGPPGRGRGRGRIPPGRGRGRTTTAMTDEDYRRGGPPKAGPPPKRKPGPRNPNTAMAAPKPSFV